MTLAAALASVVAALAALGAVLYARETVRQAKRNVYEARLARVWDERDRKLRRLERMGELLGVIATESELRMDWFKVWGTQKLLVITLAAVGPDTRERLPKASEVATMGIGDANFSQAVDLAREAQDEVRDLLGEIADEVIEERGLGD